MGTSTTHEPALMSAFPNSRRLLRDTALRLWLISFGRRWRWTFLTLCTVYAVALIASRTTGWLAGHFLAIHLPIMAVVALILSAVTLKKPTWTAAARRVDEHGQTRDLFLTMTLLDKSAGEFQPLVVESAEELAQTLKARDIVQFPWQKPVAQTATAALIVWCGLMWLHQFDPFGRVAEAREVAQREEKLKLANRATKERLSELDKAEEAAEKESEVAKALEKLKHVLGKTEKNKPSENSKALASEQKDLGKLWRQMSAEKMAEMLMKSQTDQAFGEPGKESQQTWIKELAEGNAAGLRKELREMQQLAEKIAKATDPAEKAELKQELKKKLQRMKSFASEKLQNKALKAALDRALEQLEASKQEKLEKEAAEGMKESMELAQKELEQVEMSAQEMQQLEEALKTIQMAKMLNEEGQLGSEEDDGFTSIEEYREMYEEMMAEMGGEGGEEGNPGDSEGMGQGEPEAEDDSVKTGFKPEQSRSAVRAGKMLLSINTKGLPPSDAAAEEVKTKYRELVKTVKGTAEEAIQQEQIPPGYHDSIKNYFNSLEETPAAGPNK